MTLLLIACGVLLAWVWMWKQGPYDSYEQFRLHQEVETERDKREGWPF